MHTVMLNLHVREVSQLPAPDGFALSLKEQVYSLGLLLGLSLSSDAQVASVARSDFY